MIQIVNNQRLFLETLGESGIEQFLVVEIKNWYVWPSIILTFQI